MSADHNATIASFCDITGSQPHIAEHYLSASGWDLNRSVEFFLESPPDVAVAASGAAVGGGGVMAHPIDDDMDAGEGMMDAGTAGAGGGYGAAAGGMEDRDWHGAQDEDDELQRALAASLNNGDADPPRPAAQPRPRALPPSLRGTGVGATRDRGGGGGFGDGGGGPRSHMVEDEDDDGDNANPLPSIYPGNDGRGFPTASTRRGGYGSAGPSRTGPRSAQPFGGQPAVHPGPHGNNDIDDDVPEGIDAAELEEARMLEAAILGVPYRGARDFAAEAAELAAMEADAALDEDYEDDYGGGAYGGGRPARRRGAAVGASPATRETRSLRWEQDRDYEESLKADKAKTDAVARAKREEREAAARAEREAAEAAALKAAQAAEAAALAGRKAADLARVREAKRQALPAEPVAGDPDGITIMVRLPDGSRTSRRFRRSDPLKAVFDYVDVREEQQQQARQAAAAANESAGAAGDGKDQLLPGTYNLVAQFPRKVFVEATGGSLSDHGLVSDQALLVEVTRPQSRDVAPGS